MALTALPSGMSLWLKKSYPDFKCVGTVDCSGLERNNPDLEDHKCCNIPLGSGLFLSGPERSTFLVLRARCRKVLRMIEDPENWKSSASQHKESLENKFLVEKPFLVSSVRKK